MREAAEAFGAVEEVCQETGENGVGMHWRACFADTRDAEVCSDRRGHQHGAAASDALNVLYGSGTVFYVGVLHSLLSRFA